MPVIIHREEGSAIAIDEAVRVVDVHFVQASNVNIPGFSLVNAAGKEVARFKAESVAGFYLYGEGVDLG